MIFMVLMIMMLMSIQPILMVIGLVLFTFFYSMYMYMYMGSYWYSYALVMIMLSGVFVIFSYMASLMPNEGFEIYEVVIFMVILLLFLYEIDNEFKMNMDYVSLNLWVNYVGVVSLFLVYFLLSIMILVVWMSNKKVGAIKV